LAGRINYVLQICPEASGFKEYKERVMELYKKYKG